MYCYVTFALLLGSAVGFQSNPRLSVAAPFSRLNMATTASDASSTSSGSDNIGEEKPSKFEPDFKAYGNGYKTVFTEIPYADCKASSGTIPSDLKGTYFRTGPGTKQNTTCCIEIIHSPVVGAVIDRKKLI